MESSTRNVLILVVAIVLIVCCCFLVAAVAAIGWFTPTMAVRQQSFDVSAAPNLEIDSFAGPVVVRAGESRMIRVVATKRSPLGANLDQIEVEVVEQNGSVVVKAKNPSRLRNAWVRLEITAPADTRLDLHTGSGSIEVRGLTADVRVDSASGSVEIDDVIGAVDAHTASGSIDVHGAKGVVHLDTSSGSIEYHGAPEGDCRFETGSGSITLQLPADLDMGVDLGTGSGSVDVDFPVDNARITKREVKGVVGNGDKGTIYARTGSGSIELIRR
jgi:DUF4097 and DUF4098 domain-containing protein YvlB